MIGTIIGGDLRDVLGPRRRSGAWTFVPADVRLQGSSFSPECHLREERATIDADDELRDFLDRGLEAVWVRARLKALFGCDSPPEGQRPEKSLVYLGFVAAQDGDASPSYLFECTDYYGRAHLFFGEASPDAGAQSELGHAFWTALLAEPEELSDYQDRSYHLGAGVWMHYGRRDGQFYFEERADE